MSRWMRFVQPLITLAHWRPNRSIADKAVIVLGMLLVGAVAFGLGRSIGLGATNAQTPHGETRPISPGLETANTNYGADYSGRVVAYIYGNVPIYRADLAEYLIARFGTERLEFLVNRKIVERACQAAGIQITDREVEDQFRRDLAGFGPHVTPQIFEAQVLKRYNKTIFEWKEDVIRPKLALARLVASEVQVTEDDLRKGFDIRYGPKVQCRMIVFKDSVQARGAWQRMHASDNPPQAFLDEAKKQYIGDLAAVNGEVPPIHKHFGDPRIEKEAFSLKPGEISQAFGMPDGTAIVLMCQSRLPADGNKTFDTERLPLLTEVRQQKLAEKIQEKVVRLRQEAAPRLLLARQPNIEQVRRDALEELSTTPEFKSIDKK